MYLTAYWYLIVLSNAEICIRTLDFFTTLPTGLHPSFLHLSAAPLSAQVLKSQTIDPSLILLTYKPHTGPMELSKYLSNMSLSFHVYVITPIQANMIS